MTSHFHSFTNREVSVVAYYNVGACSLSLVFLQGCSHCRGHARQTNADAGQEDGDAGRVSLPDSG